MSDEIEKIYDLLYDAYSLEHGKTKISMIEEALSLADIYGDEELQIDTRNDLIEAAVFGGEHEKAIVAFSWLNQKYKESPELINTFDFLWKYKWILSQIYSFPHITRSQIDAIFADAIECYNANGASLRPIYKSLCSLEMYSGNKEKAFEHYQKWLSTLRDSNSDCHACELTTQVGFQGFYENDEQALDVAKPILNGKMKCAEVPHGTYGRIMLPLIRLNRFDEAQQTFNTGYKMVSKNKDFLSEIGKYLLFQVLTNNTKNAVGLFEKHLSWAVETKHLDERFEFYNMSWLLFDKLESNGKTEVKLHLPNSFKHYKEDGIYNLAELKTAFESHLSEIADLFDKRNGNRFYAETIEKNKSLRKYAFELEKQIS